MRTQTDGACSRKTANGGSFRLSPHPDSRNRKRLRKNDADLRGILYGLLQRGLHPCACKCGPDYIDPMFHSRVLGVETGNLDSFYGQRNHAERLLPGERGSVCDCGRHGYYDGCGFTEKGSARRNRAALTQTPVILTINARGMSRSVLAVLYGFLAAQTEQNIRGVIFNQLPAKLYPDIRREAEAMGGVRALGYLPPFRGDF